MRENANPKSSKYEHFSRSVKHGLKYTLNSLYFCSIEAGTATHFLRSVFYNANQTTLIIALKNFSMVSGSNRIVAATWLVAATWSNIDELLQTIKNMSLKCQKFGVKNIFISGLVYTTRIKIIIFWKKTCHDFCQK